MERFQKIQSLEERSDIILTELKDEKKIYIRADMNEVIATGHVMRCLAIADAARNKGVETVFISADEKPVALISERGYTCDVLHTEWNNMDEELPVISKYIRNNHVKNLLVDSYQVTVNYLESLQKLSKVSYIEDIGKFKYNVEHIICYANYYEKFGFDNHSGKNLLGCEYVPLRQEFTSEYNKNISKETGSVLLVSGGTDPYGILDKLSEVLTDRKYNKIIIICGRFYEGMEALKERYINDERVSVYKSVDNLIDYMKEADLVISAGGTTLYELCCMGVPTITFSIADNQYDNVNKFNEDGLMMYSGDVRYDDVPKKGSKLLDIYDDQKFRLNISEKMKKMVDGKGAARIVDAIMD